MDCSVSLLVEVPEMLYDAVKQYMETRPAWDKDRVFTTAIALFLLQNRGSESGTIAENQHQLSRIYLDNLFKQPAESKS